MTEPISMPARLDATALDAFAPQLKAACSGGDILLDASGVTHLGALGLQLLVCAARHQQSLGGTLAFSDISDRATDQLSMMGVTPQQLLEGMQ